MPDPRRIAAMRTQHHHIRNIDSRLTFENAPLHTASAICLVVAFDHIYAFNQQLVLSRQDFNDAAGFAAVLAGDNDDPVVLY